MDTEGNPPVSAVKRALVCVFLLLPLGAIGAYVALTASNPKLPHPWGKIRLMQYSTNGTDTLANFRFSNLFDWPVFLEVGLEVRNDRGWEMARGYSFFVPVEKKVAAKGRRDFSVPVPFDCKAWRVLVRAAKADPTENDLRRERIKRWLESHGARSLADRIKIVDPNGYILPGPEMKYDKPGRLATAH